MASKTSSQFYNSYILIPDTKSHSTLASEQGSWYDFFFGSVFKWSAKSLEFTIWLQDTHCVRYLDGYCISLCTGISTTHVLDMYRNKLSTFYPTFETENQIPTQWEERKMIHVSSFSSISYWNNREYWTQKGTQSRNIHSIILDVQVEKQIAQNSPFNSPQCRLDKNLTLSLLFPWKLIPN